MITRRRLLAGGAALAGGGVLFGWLGYRRAEAAVADRAAALTDTRGGRLLAGWVRIDEDGAVTVYVPHVDMGQGTQTALAMQLIEEMDGDWDRVSVAPAPADPAFANWFLALAYTRENGELPGAEAGWLDPVFRIAARRMHMQLTAGSTAVRTTGEFGFRLIGAAIRAVMVDSAAAALGVPAAELSVDSGQVTHAQTGRALDFGTLAADAATRALPARPRQKAVPERWLTGRPRAGLDIPGKVTGRTRYAIDIALPGMLHATVRHPPVRGHRLEAVDLAAARAVPGVVDALVEDNTLFVLADSHWHAEQGADVARPRFAGPAGPSSAALTGDRLAALDTGPWTEVEVQGEPAEMAGTMADADLFDVTLDVPYLHHATLEPMNATARMQDGKLDVWIGHQDPLGARADAATLTGLAFEDVTLHPCPIGGSFGLRVRTAPEASGPLRQVCLLARHAAPRAVKLIWPRDQDMKQGRYRPAATSRIRIGSDATGLPVLWDQTYTEGVVAREIAHPIPYAIPHQRFRSVPRRDPVTVGAFRGVNASQHGFWREAALDAWCAARGADPLDIRLRLLSGDARGTAVLGALADVLGPAAGAPGTGRGLGYAEGFGGTRCAVGFDLTADGPRPRILRTVAVVDCGQVVNPLSAAQQVEGAIVQAVSTALAERITLTGGAVDQSYLSDYGVIGMDAAPRGAEVIFILSDAPPSGLGESAFPPVSSALLEALAQATGDRRASLPLM
ncbi:xanthine dehydrogenase family protein molybdopterin-binding subunit [Frigidibacter oleivorans]|uniref:xanthine dehydrogenase family protein molybdopterin-binding subunit n=1 Tax=Frigidibacter oleivorans TaxID=2487129 RepID=UPI0013DEE89E|nr:molybdopterin cofactor-binding domain-containing protein [Frigidibacter oleivorans]